MMPLLLQPHRQEDQIGFGRCNSTAYINLKHEAVTTKAYIHIVQQSAAGIKFTSERCRAAQDNAGKHLGLVLTGHGMLMLRNMLGLSY